jgi:hypothetical protein
VRVVSLAEIGYPRAVIARARACIARYARRHTIACAWDSQCTRGERDGARCVDAPSRTPLSVMCRHADFA